VSCEDSDHALLTYGIAAARGESVLATGNTYVRAPAGFGLGRHCAASAARPNDHPGRVPRPAERSPAGPPA